MSADKKVVKQTYASVVDMVSMLNGASVGNAGVLTLLHSVESFGAGLRTAQQTHAALSTVQLQALTNALIELRRAPTAVAATAGYVAGANALPPGAPVVT